MELWTLQRVVLMASCFWHASFFPPRVTLLAWTTRGRSRQVWVVRKIVAQGQEVGTERRRGPGRATSVLPSASVRRLPRTGTAPEGAFVLLIWGMRLLALPLISHLTLLCNYYILF